MADKNVEVTLKDVRLSFLNVFEPQMFKDEKTGNIRYTYNANILVPKKLPDGTANPQVKMLADAMRQALEATWAGQDKKIPAERRCVRDGEPVDPDDSSKRYPLYEGYEGCVFVSANRGVDGPDAPNPVQLLGPRKTAKKDDGTPCFPRLKKSDGLLYSGCFADVIIRIYGYDGKGNNPDRINASLEAIKFKRHGDAFGAKPVNADAAFDEEEGDDGFDTPSEKPAAAAAATDDLLG